MQVGDRIGAYELREEIKSGGQATIFKVWNSGLQRMEAMKIPLAHLAHDPDYVTRFRRGARLAANLQHPHIVQIFAVSDEASPQLFYTMQYIEGGDLSDEMARARLEPHRALALLRDIAVALDFAHLRGIVHRDIKPANILLEKPETSHSASDAMPYFVKVVDFEIARALGEDGATNLTQTGMVIGSLPYMSPEQAGSNEPVNQCSDQYSLGITAYEMLCGRPPFIVPEGANPISVAIQHIHTPPPAPSVFNADLSPAVEAVLIRALAKSASARFPSCGEFIAALERAFQTPVIPKPKIEPQVSEPTVVAPKVTPDAKPSTPVMPSRVEVKEPVLAPPINSRKNTKTGALIPAAIAASLCAGAALIGWALYPSPSTPPPLSPTPMPTSVAASTPAVTPVSSGMTYAQRATDEIKLAHSYNISVAVKNQELETDIKTATKKLPSMSAEEQDRIGDEFTERNERLRQDAKKAIAHARTAMRLDATNSKANYELCYALYNAGELPQAVQEIKRLHERFPDFDQKFPDFAGDLKMIAAMAKSAR